MTDYEEIEEERIVKKRKTKFQVKREREIEEFRQMLQSPSARAFVWRLLSYCGVFQSLSVLDPHSMAIRSGLRDAGLWVMSEIFDTDPKLFTLMQSEAKERDNAR